MEISPNEIHLFLGCSDDLLPQLSVYSQYLNPEEQSRAGRLVFPKDRTQFTLYRGFLRSVLSEYLQVPPQEVPILYGPQKKPYLPEIGGRRIHFNLSHSGNRVAYAFSVSGELGVDIEAIQAKTDGKAIVERYFCAEEIAWLKNFPPPEQSGAFFQLWTLKEALLKGMGEGFHFPLDQVAIRWNPKTRQASYVFNGNNPEGPPWKLELLDLSTPYCGALAHRLPEAKILTYPISSPGVQPLRHSSVF